MTLEALFRRLVRAAVHDEVRVKGVPDALLSETSASSCVRDNWMTDPGRSGSERPSKTADLRGPIPGRGNIGPPMYRQVPGLTDRVALAADVQEKEQSQEICAVSDVAKTTPAPIEDDDTPATTPHIGKSKTE